MQVFLVVIGVILFGGLLGLLYWGYWNARKLIAKFYVATLLY